MLTGDRALRKVGNIEGVTVYGTIWLIEQMIVQGIIDIDRAETGFAQMRENARRLPWAKAEQLVTQYRG